MIVYPALDIFERKAVRLYKGDFSKISNFGDPFEKVSQFVNSGASWIHVVDLKAAKGDAPIDFEFLERIIKKAKPCHIQYGGGIRHIDEVEKLFEIGVNRVILSTQAVKDRNFLEVLAKKHPYLVAVSVDVKEGFIAIKGWQEKTKEKLADFIVSLAGLKLGALIITDISKDGTLAGPGFKTLRVALKVSAHPLIASGGVSNLEDVIELSKLNEDGKFLDGVIIGTAIHNGSLNLKEALLVCK
jgi:phosphoribosylformimino-5-aminoimidazole carboxamide ribotide isomerase